MMIKYVSGKLSFSEKHEVEKHLVDCSLCSDAVEGLNMISDKSRISGIATDVNDMIRIRVEKKEIGLFQQYRVRLAIAASIVGMLGMVWLFRENISMNKQDATTSEKIFADKFKAYPPPQEATGNTEDIPGTVPEIIGNGNIEKEKAENKEREFAQKFSSEGSKNKEDSHKAVEEEGRTAAFAPPESKAGAADGSLAFAEKEDSLSQQMQEEIAVVPAASEDVRREAAKEENKDNHSLGGRKTEKQAATRAERTGIKSAPVSNAVVPEPSNITADPVIQDLVIETADADIAMKQYEQKNYSGAAESFEKILVKDPADYKALFYSSVCYLSMGQTDKAIVNLTKILEYRSEGFYDDVQWYLSLAYIRKNDFKSASRILLELQKNPKSKYQKQAGETLKEIEK